MTPATGALSQTADPLAIGINPRLRIITPEGNLSGLINCPITMSESIYAETMAFWQPQCRRRLTAEDARQIVSNIRGYFSVLVEWDRAAQDARSTSSEAFHDRKPPATELSSLAGDANAGLQEPAA